MRLPGSRFRRLLLICVGCGIASAGFGCGRRPEVAPDTTSKLSWFQDATREVGLSFVHNPGSTNEFFMPQTVGSGCALFDFDNDGRLDILLLQNAGKGSEHRHQLYHQENDGQFRNVSDGSGIDVPGLGMGVICGDVNNDGRIDVCISEYGGLRLFLNDGGGRFRDVTTAAGLRNTRWGVSAAFFDYDRDGWLDLFVANYVDYDSTWPCFSPSGAREYCGPQTFSGTASVLFHNRGLRETEAGPAVGFDDASVTSGIADRISAGLGCHAADYDADGWPDLLVANDEAANHLWINQRDGTFREEAVIRGIALNRSGEPEANMGIAYGDVDGDGLCDVLISHLTTETHTLWRQYSPGQFQDETSIRLIANLASRRTGFGTGLLDLDRDGDLDLVVVAGRVLRGTSPLQAELGPHWSPYAERNQLFSNTDGRFEDISTSNPELCDQPRIARGLSWGDIDNDGDLDLLVNYLGGTARLYRNVAVAKGHWLMVKAVLPQHKRDALGAEVTLVSRQRRWVGLVQTCGSYASSQDPQVHFGLGSCEKLEQILVKWPDGTHESFPAPSVDQRVEVKQGTGTTIEPAPGTIP